LDSRAAGTDPNLDRLGGGRGDPAADDVALAAVQARLPTLEVVRGRSRVRTALASFGPAMVASVAYVDPGNFATNLAGGARHGYQLVWVVVMANVMAVLVQYLTSKACLDRPPARSRLAPSLEARRM